tara:strand:+ start:2374 stop:2559 length:186 start_codon:yes stop_codon:yes gene_type:complete
MTELPTGWTVQKGRFLWELLYNGERRSSGGTEEAVRNAINLQPEYYNGLVSVIKIDKAVDL